ncbi:4'-phosphopantetheinyl transferase family protein [Nocardia asteroides]|uniref:4'-phosphopantetheinyl transferase family protein n=1 Tax=Nocardia asteroides TaxID=1824 RepID=UPI001E5A81E1|nr:4'-phosphopantetheinyl transferase superfamily protein [Nocardia asteroides]UGT61024.1 4'-phosphopantetheinyl transferase superfamily protein [Nocardia asteroides]
MLSDDDRRRADSIADPAARGRFVTAHAATRLILGRRLAVAPTQLIWRPGRWGKPAIAGHEGVLRFSLSHSADRALLAVTGPRDIGVDVERRRLDIDHLRLSRRYFLPEESMLVAAAHDLDRADIFTRLWTRKEACTKAAGTRMLGRGLRIPAAEAFDAVHGGVVHDPAGTTPGPWLVFDLTVAAGYHAAVALDGITPARIDVRRWQPQ